MAAPLNETLLANKRYELELAKANHKYGRAEHLEGEIAKLTGGKVATSDFVLNDRAKVGLWLDHIQELDPAVRESVYEQCKSEEGARAYYVSRYNQMIAEK
jgi:hypothetical protein